MTGIVEKLFKGMKEVTKEEFYAVVGPLDVHPHPRGSYYPYYNDWELRNRRLIGRSFQGRYALIVREGVKDNVCA